MTASLVARWPARVVPSVTQNRTTVQSPTRSLKSLRVIAYSSTVVISIASRLTARAAASPPMLLAAAASTG